MLSFATEFPTRETHAESFVSAVREWLTGSPHSRFPMEAFDTFPESGFWSATADDESLEAIVIPGSDARVAFRYRKFEGPLTWTTTVVYASDAHDAWVGIRTFRDSAQPRPDLPTAKKPFLVRTLLKKVGGGLDAEVHVSDAAHLLQDNDLAMTARLTNGDSDNHLPVVYVSRNFDETLPLDVDVLAKWLAGMAHVVVEPSRAFSVALQGEVASRNAYGGTTGVYWPGGIRRSFYLSDKVPSEHHLRIAIKEHIQTGLLNRRPLRRCTWEDAELVAARSIIDDLRSSGSSDLDEYIKAFDVEAKARSEQLRQAETEIYRLRAEIRALEATGSSYTGNAGLSVSNETELYPGEFREVMLDALAEARNRLETDRRRRHILDAVEGIDDDRNLAKTKREEVKAILRDYRSMDSSVQDGLKSLGFSIYGEGKHYKVIFKDDERYTYILPKTASDHRSGLNSASDISKRLF
jgi:hypothetical protein